jgi:hypothetical protein
MRMVSILDTIEDHLQMDPTARHLFEEDDDDEIKTTAATEDRVKKNDMAGQTEEEYLNYYIENNVPMTMLKENCAGIKRGFQRQKTYSHSTTSRIRSRIIHLHHNKPLPRNMNVQIPNPPLNPTAKPGRGGKRNS